jgi:hypothetical protein
MSWESRADLTESMVGPACDLAGLVHDGDADGIARFLAKHGLGDAAPPAVKALVIVLAAMVPVDERSDAELLAWVGGGPLTVLPHLRACDPEPEPEPDGHTAQELKDAVAEATRLRRAGREVPADVAKLAAAYSSWRRRVQEARKMAGPKSAARADNAAAA